MRTMTQILTRIALLVVPVVAVGQTPTQWRGTAEWTFMVYLAADNNLDRAAMEDVDEMEMVGSSKDVRIVVLIDRWNAQAGPSNWTTAKRAILLKKPGAGAQSLYDPAVSEDIGEVNTGDPQTLVEFVKWGATVCPSRKRALIIWNHGGGWRSFNDEFAGSSRSPQDLRNLSWSPTPGIRAVCFDAGSSDDALYTKELRNALETCGVTFDIVAFDACLMGMLEVAYELKDITPYVVASEENVATDGFNYTTLLAALGAQAGATPFQVGSLMLESYNLEYGSAPNATLALIASDRLPELVASINSLVAQVAQEDNEAGRLACRQELAHARASAGPTMAENRLPYVDLGTFLQCAAHHGRLSQNLRASADQALKSYERARLVYVRTGERRRTGLSIFFPPLDTTASMLDAYCEDNLVFAKDCCWDQFVKSFATNVPLADLVVPSAPGEQPPDGSVSEMLGFE